MNIAEILKDCPSGTRLYSPIYGELSLEIVQSFDERCYPIHCRIIKNGNVVSFTKDGRSYSLDAEPTLFPSKNQRDWSKFRVSDQVGEIEARGHTKTKKDKNNMTRTKYKRIPFDIELAKKIMNKEVKGRIVTMEGRKVRIICWDKKPVDEEAHEYPIVALIQNNYNGEMSQTFTAEGAACYPNYKSRYDLIIEIPTYYRDYSNFVPQKWQPCLVRDNENHLWGIQVYSHTDCQGKMLFYNDEGYVIPYTKVLPLSKVTARLIGTTKNYEQLIEELDENGKD